MKIKINIFLFSIVTSILLSSCGGKFPYSFSGANIEAKTIQIDYFPNNATLVEPTLSSKFTQALQDMFLRQTSLNMVKTGGELQFEGEITNYTINPTSATSIQTAALNRLTVTVKVRFFNNLNDKDNFDKTFSHYYDYGANEQLSGSTLENAYAEIFERITQDIFNESVAKW
jgi:hypothetical protein